MAADTPLFGRLPSPRDPLGSYRVCLVCLGNICRSPMAEVVLTDELARAGLAGQVEVDSAGTGDWHIGGPMDAGARAELARRGYDGSAHRARLFDPAWFPGRDLVLAMDRRNLAQLRRMAPDAESGGARLLLFRSFDPVLANPVLANPVLANPVLANPVLARGDLATADPYDGEVPDPYGGEAENYALALDLVQAAARGLAAALAGLLEVPAPGPGG
jgi:protein-tyrosine phosphatase